MSLLQGHWYTQDGLPYTETIDDVQQVKDLDLLPSVTTILKICHNHSLAKWISNERDKAWFELKRYPHETLKDAKARVNKIANEESSKARNKGSFVHAIAENYWKGILTGEKTAIIDETNDYEKKVLKTVEAIHKEVFPKLTPLKVEEIVKTRTYAGTLDLAGVAGDENFLIDFKTQTVKKGREFFVYPSYWAQTAAYAAPTFDNHSDVSTFIVLIDPVTLKWKVEFHTGMQLIQDRITFLHCLELFRGPMGLWLDA